MDSFYKRSQAIHDWNPSTKEAKQIQNRLSQKILFKDTFGTPEYIAGADVGFDKKRNEARAAIVILQFGDLSVVESSVVTTDIPYSYIPGFLSFREAPPLLQALDKLSILPDIILCDSQGYAHPRRFGLACHLGVLTDLPAIGVAKSRLIGKYHSLPREKGSSVPLMDEEEQVGIVLRTRTDVNPLFISVGHRVSLPRAENIVMGAVSRFKLPETTRAADRLAST